MTELQARKVISSLRPHAKFVEVIYSKDYMPPDAKIEKDFFQVSLYDENVSSDHVVSNQGVLIIHNSYLSSFAYNLGLAWLYESSKKQIAIDEINPVLKYNFKKFYAEQLYSNLNNVFSRAILLETLLYEEPQMRPVFALADQNATFSNLSQTVSRLFSDLILFHELAHYYLKFSPERWGEIYKRYEPILKQLLEEADTRFKEKFVEEIKCDVFAILTPIVFEELTMEEKKIRLRMIIFGFEAFAQLWSLKTSAEETANSQKSKTESIAFYSIEKSKEEYVYIVPHKTTMDFRSEIAIALCEAVARMEKIDLYNNDGEFPLPKGIGKHFSLYAYNIMEGMDDHKRAIARLIAEGFHKHPEGMEYIYLNSKVFKSNQKLEL